MHHNPKIKQNRVNIKTHLWCFSIIAIFSRALQDLLTKSKSGLPLVLTRYSPKLEPSCGTQTVEKIGRGMDLGGRTCGENFWREKGNFVWFCNSKLQNQLLTKNNHPFNFQSIPFISKLHATFACSELPLSTLGILPSRCLTCMKSLAIYMQYIV